MNPRERAAVSAARKALHKNWVEVSDADRLTVASVLDAFDGDRGAFARARGSAKPPDKRVANLVAEITRRCKAITKATRKSERVVEALALQAAANKLRVLSMSKPTKKQAAERATRQRTVEQARQRVADDDRREIEQWIDELREREATTAVVRVRPAMLKADGSFDDGVERVRVKRKPKKARPLPTVDGHVNRWAGYHG